MVGDLNAPVVIFDFADFQCPFCKRHHDETLPLIYDHYIQTGLVRYVVKDFPLSTIHPQAQKASEAAECAGAQNVYWQMHDKLYDEQAQWSGNSGAVALFKQYARNLGLDGPAFDACLDGGIFSAEVLEDRQEGMTAGVRGTPMFFFYGPNGSASLLCAYPYDAFQQIIDSLLNGEMGMACLLCRKVLSSAPIRLDSSPNETVFPQIIGLASTWQPELANAMAWVVRMQMRAVGAHQGISPVLDVVRDPRWGRVGCAAPAAGDGRKCRRCAGGRAQTTVSLKRPAPDLPKPRPM